MKVRSKVRTVGSMALVLMVGANQAQDVMRKQNITRVPAARFHFFNDVVESVIEYMVTVNNYELAQAQAGTPFYPEPHMAHLGSRHRYNADVIFFHSNSDHMTFNEAPIGVPGTSFTNMPDRYIHSSDDDLWNVDRTQLGRNAVAVALMAYTMASADGSTAPTLAAETVGRGMERLGRNVRLTQTWIAQASDKDVAYHQGVDQVAYAVDREVAAISSLGEIDANSGEQVESLLEELERRSDQAIREIQLAYRQATGQNRLPRRSSSETESNLAGLRPSIAAGPTEFLTGRGQIAGVRGLHGSRGHHLGCGLRHPVPSLRRTLALGSIQEVAQPTSQSLRSHRHTSWGPNPESTLVTQSPVRLERMPS